MNYQWYDVIGNIGVLIILGCYLLLQLNKLASSELSFSVFNGLGALLILISLTYEFNLSAFIIELFWLLISLFGVTTYLLKRRATS
ncbi:MAG: CBU_0592 family membrane protein [Pseudomonadales bacterium]|jgi:hypothetical protein|tara:strand:+ start:2923 stop:3180 length:258 start_codon:yes stop_codon:yes gene_type:complete